jgi:hypothetical protein
MTISEPTLKSSDIEPVRRFEVFTGTGRRRDGETGLLKRRRGSWRRATMLGRA